MKFHWFSVYNFLCAIFWGIANHLRPEFFNTSISISTAPTTCSPGVTQCPLFLAMFTWRHHLLRMTSFCHVMYIIHITILSIWHPSMGWHLIPSHLLSQARVVFPSGITNCITSSVVFNDKVWFLSMCSVGGDWLVIGLAQ